MDVERAVKSQAVRKNTLHCVIRASATTEKIYEKTVKAGVFSHEQMQVLLRTLVARDLSFDEVLGACAKNKTKLHNDLLQVHKEGTHPFYFCGHSRHFTAHIAEYDYKGTNGSPQPKQPIT